LTKSSIEIKVLHYAQKEAERISRFL